MRPCLVKVALPDRQHVEAKFHQWGNETVESHDGNIANTLAIVEFPDGSVDMIPPGKIVFPPPATIDQMIAAKVVNKDTRIATVIHCPKCKSLDVTGMGEVVKGNPLTRCNSCYYSASSSMFELRYVV